MDKKSQAINPKPLFPRLLIGATALLVILLTLNYFKIISFDNILNFGNKFSNLNLSGNVDQSKIIAKIGQENIYQKDLNSELHNYPDLKNVDAKKLLVDKLTRDSIVLQAAQADGFVKLDGSVYNSLQKDYTKRIGLINSVKKKIEDNSAVLTGGIVSLWFYNRGPGRVGYDKGREIARTAITKLQADVVSKKLTIQQAGQSIRNDPNLGRVDPAYLTNALLEFSKSPQEPIVFDNGFDAIIKKLKTNEVSDIYLAKSNQWDQGKKSDKMIDAVYMFAQVTSRKKTPIDSFDSWYSQKTKSYAVTYY